VVCARQPESERYRIPKKLRNKPASPGGRSWTSRVAANDEAQHDMLPTGCSVVNSSALGCLAKAFRQWSAERRMAQSESQP
jgi:CHAD domain-containing protein